MVMHANNQSKVHSLKLLNQYTIRNEDENARLLFLAFRKSVAKATIKGGAVVP